MQKFEYFKNQRSFLEEIKNIFHNYLRAVIWLKNNGHKLQPIFKSKYRLIE